MLTTPQIDTIELGADAKLLLVSNFLSCAKSNDLLLQLEQGLLWQQSEITVYGQRHKIPRLQALHGDPACWYRFSATDFHATPWTPELSYIRQQINARHQLQFNSVLANLYRDGNDCIGWHSDNEPCLGSNPTIASVSFGETRRFLLRRRESKHSTAKKFELGLRHGSLLIMLGVQRHWQHSVPRTKKPKGIRINLTFRQIHTDNDGH